MTSNQPYEHLAPQALADLGLLTAAAQLDQATQQAAAGQWSYSHFLGYLLAGELAERQRKTVALNLKFANLPYHKTPGGLRLHGPTQPGPPADR